ncbi:MAG: response regulator [Nitrososphaerota archaeon]
MRFLIIDDAKKITEPLKDLIKLEGHDCVVTDDGQKGLKLIKEQKWDGVVLDLAMPQFSGYDVIDNLEKEGMMKNNKIIVFTAVSITDGDIEKLRSRGIHSCLRKPASIEKILSVLGIK